jgi:hypothetical protein
MIEFVHSYVTPEGLSPVVGDADDGRAIVLGESEVRDHRALLSTGAALFGRPEWKARAGFFREDSLWLLGPRAFARFEELPAIEGNESRTFEDSGFAVLKTAGQYLFVDAGPVGAGGTGGHGHNDCLSFEWHAQGRPLPVRLTRTPDHETLEAGHTGYRRLSPPVTVFRKFTLAHRSERLRLADRLEGVGVHSVEFFFHAAPGARAGRLGEAGVEFRWPDSSRVRIERASGPDVHWEERSGWFSPSYGIKLERPVWVARTELELPFQVEWELTASF